MRGRLTEIGDAKRVGGGRMKKEVFIKSLPAPKKELYEVAPTPKT